ncbi:MAG: DmsE family decaheme c-type cytochrome [Bryobacteraceae bacterium]|jgi:DmsE family decaheme c-type cytochrome
MSPDEASAINRVLRLFAIAAFLSGIAGAQQTPPPPPAAPKTPAGPALKPGYAGSDACKVCHEEIYNSFAKSPHFTVETDKSRGWAAQSCEACHGPGAKHADSADAKDIRQPAKLPPPEADQVCLACHLNNTTSFGRIMTGHAKETVGCPQCHAIHGTGGRRLVERKTAEINSQCASCHISIWAAFQKPYKHRLPEGAMSCTDCHNPHADNMPQSMRVSFGNEPTCFRCHSDKRGPFVFEHAPVRLEGCVACHEPHGSANPRMLTRAQVRFVCLECHANTKPGPPPASPLASLGGTKLNNIGQTPPSFHNLLLPQFQNCTVCHVKTHGSYVDGNLLR